MKKRFSESEFWCLHKKLYEDLGPKTWTHEGMPCYLTTSPFLVVRYVRLFDLQLRFWLSQGILNPDDVIYILDLGCGIGRCGYLVLNLMQDLFQNFPVRLKYVFVDLAEENLQFILDHHDLKPFFEKGYVDVAKFDAMKDETMTLRLSQDVLESDRLTNPLLIIANYFFDSLPHDLFISDDGKLYEMSVDLIKQEEGESLPNSMRSVQLSLIRGEEVDPESYYSHSSWNYALKKTHEIQLKNDFNIPVGAFRVLDLITSWSPPGYCLLASDQGSSLPKVLENLGGHCTSSPAMGSLSVNYFSLKDYLQANQQDVLTTQSKEQTILVTAIATDRSSGSCLFPLFTNFFDLFGMVQFWEMVNDMTKAGVPSLDFIEHLLRLGNYDPAVFFPYFDTFRKVISDLSTSQRRIWVDCLVQVAKIFFPFTPRDYPLLGDLGILLFELGATEDALDVFMRVFSLDYGQENTANNIKICLQAMGRQEEFEQLRKKLIENRKGLSSI